MDHTNKHDGNLDFTAKIPDSARVALAAATAEVGGIGGAIPEAAGIKGHSGHEEHDKYSMKYHTMKEVGFTKLPQGHVSTFKPPESVEDTIYVTIKMKNEEFISDNLPVR